MITFTGIVHPPLFIPELCITPGHTAIIGPNGSGKTTLLRMLAGFITPIEGEITIRGISGPSDSVGWVDENPDRNILFSRVYDEISSSLRFSHLPSDEIEQKVSGICTTWSIDHLLNRRMEELSGGEKITVALAAATINTPEILILDEPDAHLDKILWHTIINHIKKINPDYSIVATHQMEIASEADQLIYLEKGTIMHCGTPEKVFSQLKETCYYPLLWRMRNGYQY